MAFNFVPGDRDQPSLLPEQGFDVTLEGVEFALGRLSLVRITERYERKLWMRGPGDGRGVPSGRSLIGAAGAVTLARGGTPMVRVIASEDVRQEFALTLDEICRRGAERMLAIALEAEVDAYLEPHRNARDDRGHALVVRNGHARPRTVVGFKA